MAYQFKREPLTPAEADKLYQSCNTNCSNYRGDIQWIFNK